MDSEFIQTIEQGTNVIRHALHTWIFFISIGLKKNLAQKQQAGLPTIVTGVVLPSLEQITSRKVKWTKTCDSAMMNYTLMMTGQL